MFKIGVAHNLSPNVYDAARALVDEAMAMLGGPKPDVALLFSTYGRDNAGLLAQLTNLLPDCTLVGGSSNGEVSRQQGYSVGSAVLILFASDSIRIVAGVLRDLSFHDQASNAAAADKHLPRLRSGLRAQDGDTPPALGLLFPDGVGLNGDSMVKLFLNHFPTTPFFGGATAEDFQLRATEQFFNDEILHNAVPYVLFYGPLRFHHEISEGLGSGWRPVGARLDACCDGKSIITINKKPALDYLESRYRLEGGLLSVVHPFVIYPNLGSNEHYLRDVVRYSAATGALESTQLLPSKCQIQLSQPDPIEILAVSRKNIHHALAHFPGGESPAGVLWFSCVSRALVLQNDPAAEFLCATDNLHDNLPVAGFYAFGEIAPSHKTGGEVFHNATLVTLLLGEEPRPKPGHLNTADQFSVANLEQENKTLADALAQTRTELDAVRSELAEFQAINRISAHAKTEANTRCRALALGLLCELLDTQLDDFKRIALKGEPPRLNKSGLARLINDRHQAQSGQPFPFTQAQLARLLTQ